MKGATMNSPETQGIVTREQLPAVAMEHGKKRGRVRNLFIKNSSPVPNWYFDHYLEDSEIPPYIHIVFLFLLRKTIGWDKHSESLTVHQIADGTALSKPSVIHAIEVICDCWGLFKVERGRGKRPSKFTTSADQLAFNAVMDRRILLNYVYSSDCPRASELKRTPCTAEVFELACHRHELARIGQTKEALVVNAVNCQSA
jgi:hypothetical protein